MRVLVLTGVSVVEVIPRNNEITSFVFWSQVRDFHARSSCRNNLTWASEILATKLLQNSQPNVSVQKLLEAGEKTLHREPDTYSYFNRAIPKNKLSTDVFRHLPSCSKLTENAAAEFSPCTQCFRIKLTCYNGLRNHLLSERPVRAGRNLWRENGEEQTQSKSTLPTCSIQKINNISRSQSAPWPMVCEEQKH